jgi:hypothetical protein
MRNIVTFAHRGHMSVYIGEVLSSRWWLVMQQRGGRPHPGFWVRAAAACQRGWMVHGNASVGLGGHYAPCLGVGPAFGVGPSGAYVWVWVVGLDVGLRPMPGCAAYARMWARLRRMLGCGPMPCCRQPVVFRVGVRVSGAAVPGAWWWLGGWEGACAMWLAFRRHVFLLSCLDTIPHPLPLQRDREAAGKRK